MSRIVKNYLYNVSYNMLVLIAPLVTAPYLARILGAECLGIYTYVNSATSIVISISIIGLYSYGCRQIAYVRDNHEKMSQEFWNILGLRACLCVIGTIIYFVFASRTEYILYFCLYYLYYLGNAMDCTWLFVGVEDMKIPAIKNIMAKGISVIGIFVFVRDERDLWKYIFLLASATFLGMVFTYPQIRKYVTFRKTNFKSYKSHMVNAIILFLPSLVATIYLQVDKVMIEWLTGETAQISFYDQAEKIVMIPLTFITVLSTVLMPRIANEFVNKKRGIITEILSKACKVSLFMAFPMMFGIAAIANKFIPWYLGDEFWATSTVLKILSPLVLTNTLVGISGTQYFTATNQVKALVVSNSLAAIVNIIVNALLIPRFGYVGAAVATLFSNCVLVFAQYHLLSKQLSVKKMFKGTWKYFLASCLMFVIVVIIGNISPAKPLTTLVQIVSGGCVYFGTMSVVKDDLTKEIIGRIRYARTRED